MFSCSPLHVITRAAFDFFWRSVSYFSLKKTICGVFRFLFVDNVFQNDKAREYHPFPLIGPAIMGPPGRASYEREEGRQIFPKQKIKCLLIISLNIKTAFLHMKPYLRVIAYTHEPRGGGLFGSKNRSITFFRIIKAK